MADGDRNYPFYCVHCVVPGPKFRTMSKLCQHVRREHGIKLMNNFDASVYENYPNAVADNAARHSRLVSQGLAPPRPLVPSYQRNMFRHPRVLAPPMEMNSNFDKQFSSRVCSLIERGVKMAVQSLANANNSSASTTCASTTPTVNTRTVNTDIPTTTASSETPSAAIAIAVVPYTNIKTTTTTTSADEDPTPTDSPRAAVSTDEAAAQESSQKEVPSLEPVVDTLSTGVKLNPFSGRVKPLGRDFRISLNAPRSECPNPQALAEHLISERFHPLTRIALDAKNFPLHAALQRVEQEIRQAARGPGVANLSAVLDHFDDFDGATAGTRVSESAPVESAGISSADQPSTSHRADSSVKKNPVIIKEIIEISDDEPSAGISRSDDEFSSEDESASVSPVAAMPKEDDSNAPDATDGGPDAANEATEASSVKTNDAAL